MHIGNDDPCTIKICPIPNVWQSDNFTSLTVIRPAPQMVVEFGR
jgi:hypothetical protein